MRNRERERERGEREGGGDVGRRVRGLLHIIASTPGRISNYKTLT